MTVPPDTGWLQHLGMKMCDVTLVKEGGQFVASAQVDDMVTLPEICRTLMEDDRKVRAVVYPWMGRWALARLGQEIQLFDTRAAAEMVAVHVKI